MTAHAQPRPRTPYIVSPGYDWALLLSPPLWALLLGIAISGTAVVEREFVLWGEARTLGGMAIQVMIQAHLVAVLFRSHGNPEVARLHPVRFAVVPVALYAAIVGSDWVLVCASVLATFWDVYHSGLQTFGFARIYDRNAGNAATEGRRLDWWLSLLTYAGPIVAGATMLDHFEDFEQFEDVGALFFTRIPAFMSGHQKYLAWALIGGGTLFLGYYLWSYRRLARQGYRVSVLKVYLLASTGLCSIYTWGFNSWGEAFFIMNLFHAVQYLGLVWATEGRRLGRALGLARRRGGMWVALAGFLALTLGYGLWAQWVDASVRSLWAITLVVSLMHFWYDGFIWSVRANRV
ncbi:hypothetical protein [Haliangium sp.]|uniref:hypothetical protein n=1 Tax=Haliangium sp. TaxID=2663208 RepID=UPI003D0C9474